MQYVTQACVVFRCSFTHEANSSPEHCAKIQCACFTQTTLFPHGFPSGSMRALVAIVAEELSGILTCKFSEVSETPADINLECKWYLQSDYRNRSLSHGETVLHSPNSKCNTVKTKTVLAEVPERLFPTFLLQELFRKVSRNPSTHFERAICMCGLAVNILI